MVRSRNFRVDLRICQSVLQALRYHEIVNSPSGIFRPRLESVRPPGIDSGPLRIKIAESVDKSIFQYFGKTASLFVRKTGIPTIGLRIFQINLLMCHIQISRIDHRLFLFQFFQISQKIRLPLHPVIQSLPAGHSVHRLSQNRIPGTLP